MAMVLHAAAGQQGPQGPKRRDPSPFMWENHVARLTAAEFKLRYRLTAESFYTLLDMLEPALQVGSAKQAQCSKGSVTEPCTKLAVCLRFLAGGQVLDLKLIYHLSESECYHCIWLGVDAINSAITIDFPFR